MYFSNHLPDSFTCLLNALLFAGLLVLPYLENRFTKRSGGENF